MITLFKNDLKQLKNFVVIYICCLVLCAVIGGLSYQSDTPMITLYLTVLIFTLIVPIVNLKYLFNQTRQTHFNSLPFTRLQGFAVHYISGFICIVIPAMVYCFSMQGTTLKNSLALFLMVLIYYTVANLSAYLTTTFMMNVVLQIVIIIVPIVLYTSLYLIYSAFIKGILTNEFSIDAMACLIPVVKLIIAGSEGLEVNYCLIYVGYFFIYLVLAVYVCKNRRCSQNYQGFTYKIVSQIIKLVVIVSGSWILTSVLSTSSNRINTFIIVNIIATLIITFIVQFIYFKKVKCLLCIVEAALITVGTVIIFVFSKNYLENYIPHEISKVAITNTGSIYNSSEVYELSKLISDDKVIKKVVEIHEKLIKFEKPTDENTRIDIIYYQPNGRKVIRGYYVNDYQYKKIIKMIDGDLIENWNSNYYWLLKQFDKGYKVDVYSFDNNASVTENAIIEDEQDILLLQDILKRKLVAFEKNPRLLDQVKNSDFLRLDIYDEKGLFTSINFSYGDPLYQTIEEFYKIKAN